MQERRNSIADALELRLSYIKPLMHPLPPIGGFISAQQ